MRYELRLPYHYVILPLLFLVPAGWITYALFFTQPPSKSTQHEVVVAAVFASAIAIGCYILGLMFLGNQIRTRVRINETTIEVRRLRRLHSIPIAAIEKVTYEPAYVYKPGRLFDTGRKAGFRSAMSMAYVIYWSGTTTWLHRELFDRQNRVTIREALLRVLPASLLGDSLKHVRN